MGHNPAQIPLFFPEMHHSAYFVVLVAAYITVVNSTIDHLRERLLDHFVNTYICIPYMYLCARERMCVCIYYGRSFTLYITLEHSGVVTSSKAYREKTHFFTLIVVAKGRFILSPIEFLMLPGTTAFAAVTCHRIGQVYIMLLVAVSL